MVVVVFLPFLCVAGIYKSQQILLRFFWRGSWGVGAQASLAESILRKEG
jgi:hypothetical protein